jgi:hypothetical protein
MKHLTVAVDQEYYWPSCRRSILKSGQDGAGGKSAPKSKTEAEFCAMSFYLFVRPLT